MYYIRHFSPSNNILYPEDFEIISGTEEPQTGELARGSHPVQLWFGGNSGKRIRLKLDHPYTIRHGQPNPISPLAVMPGSAPPHTLHQSMSTPNLPYVHYGQGVASSHSGWGSGPPPGYGRY